MKTEMRKTDDIRPYEQNPRRNDAAVEAVARSIREFGFRQPIVVDADGNFVIGKAATTPHDQSEGFWESLADALEYWGIDLEKEARSILSQVEAAVYSGTAMMNALITAAGRKVGVITQRGDEDIFLHERSAQKWKGYAYQDNLHLSLIHI